MSVAGGAPGWRLDQVAVAGRENLDTAHVARYDRIEDFDGPAEVELLRGHGLGPGAMVVELGAGTGQFAVAAARAGAQVVAADVSPPMLAALRTKVGGEGLRGVEVVQAGFLDYHHRHRPADVVYTRYALHHVPDFWKGVALARIHDLLRPGGVLRVWDVVYGFEPAEAEARLEAWCATGGPTDGAGWSRGDYEEHVRDEHSTYTWIFESLAEHAGLVLHDAQYSTDRIFAKYLFHRPA